MTTPEGRRGKWEAPETARGSSAEEVGAARTRDLAPGLARSLWTAPGQPSASHHLHLARRGLTETGICSQSETGWPRGSAERGGKGVSTGPILPLVTHKSSFPSSPTLTRTLTHSDTAQPQMG